MGIVVRSGQPARRLVRRAVERDIDVGWRPVGPPIIQRHKDTLTLSLLARLVLILPASVLPAPLVLQSEQCGHMPSLSVQAQRSHRAFHGASAAPVPCSGVAALVHDGCRAASLHEDSRAPLPICPVQNGACCQSEPTG